MLDEDGVPLITNEGREKYGKLWITVYETAERTAAGRYSEAEVTVFLRDDRAEEIYRHTCSAYIPSFAEKNGGDENE